VHEHVTFYQDHLKLTGYLYIPTSKAPLACVVHNHGSGLSPGRWDKAMPSRAELLMAWGYAAFFPHRRGYGESEGVSLSDAIPASLGTSAHDEQLTRRMTEECRDVLAALAYVRRRPEIDSDQLAVTGHSRGGIASHLAAASDAQLRACVNFSGGARQWALHPKLRQLMLDACKRIEAPVFLAQATNDFNPNASLALAAALARLDKDHRCHIYPAWGTSHAEGHLFEVTGEHIWGPDVQAFLSRCLKPA
jgi:dienelactone hydrolase